MESNPTHTNRSSEQIGAITLGSKAASHLKDLIFQLRCAAEDVETAAEEKADHKDIAELAREVLELSQRIESIRALGPSQT